MAGFRCQVVGGGVMAGFRSSVVGGGGGRMEGRASRSTLEFGGEGGLGVREL